MAPLTDVGVTITVPPSFAMIPTYTQDIDPADQGGTHGQQHISIRQQTEGTIPAHRPQCGEPFRLWGLERRPDGLRVRREGHGGHRQVAGHEVHGAADQARHPHENAGRDAKSGEATEEGRPLLSRDRRT